MLCGSKLIKTFTLLSSFTHHRIIGAMQEQYRPEDIESQVQRHWEEKEHSK